MRISDWSSDVCSSDLRIACLARKMRFNPLPKGVAYLLSLHPCRPPNSQQLEPQSFANGNPECKRNLGSGPLNSTFEASKWRRYRAWAGAAGSIATRKAAQARDRSHFGVASRFDRFCPGLQIGRAHV